MRWLSMVLWASTALGAAATEREEAFQRRVSTVIETHAAHEGPSVGGWVGYNAVAARLYLKRDPEWCSRRVLEALKDTWGDMFWMFPVTAVSYLDRGQLSEAARTALRKKWKTYMPYRGDTENHWLLYYTSMYLIAQLYHGAPGTEWFTGKSSAENFREAESYLLHWMKLTTTQGQGEYDCTHYMGVYLLPMSYLAAWAEDPLMRQRARLMLDWLIADYAAENLNGIYVGAHARTDDRQVLEKWAGVSSDFGWLFFGLGYPLEGYSSYALFYCLASAYQPPAILDGIATDRSRDYVHQELKRTRTRWRFTDVPHAPVYKTTYMRRDYAVSSDQGGVLQPIQQHSWDVTWAVKDPRGVQNTIFSLHPYSSTHELQMYFTAMPDFITETVARSKRTYDSPDKFLGGSMYEKGFQDLDTVIALYDIPAGVKFPHINGFFSKDLRQVVEHPSGWIFAVGGKTFLAYRPLAPYEWAPIKEGGKRLFSPHRQNGTIVQAASAGEFKSYEQFQQAILALPLQAATQPAPSVRFRSLRHRNLEFTYGQEPKADGKVIHYADRKTFEGPFLQSERASQTLTLRYGNLRRIIDFKALTATDSGPFSGAH